MIKEREGQIESISLGCISPATLDLLIRDTITAADRPGIYSVLRRWEGALEDILADSEMALNFHNAAWQMARDLFLIHRALTHVAAGGEPVDVKYGSEVPAYELARIISHIGAVGEEPFDGAVAEIAAVIVEQLDAEAAAATAHA